MPARQRSKERSAIHLVDEVRQRERERLTLIPDCLMRCGMLVPRFVLCRHSILLHAMKHRMIFDVLRVAKRARIPFVVDTQQSRVTPGDFYEAQLAAFIEP
jgi:hypothetical protein